MKSIKELFRNFFKNNFIYHALGMNVGEEMKAVEMAETEAPAEEPKTPLKEEFDSYKKRALSLLKKINLDAKKGISSEIIEGETYSEESLSNDLTTKIEGAFKKLEANYRAALKKLGAGDPKIPELKAALEAKAEKFLEDVETRVLKENFAKGTKEGIALIIEKFFASKKLNTKGFAQYLIEGSKEQIPTLLGTIKGLNAEDSIEDIYEKLEEILDNEDILKLGVDALVEDLPFKYDPEKGEIEFEATNDEKTYFKSRFTETAGDGENSLSYQFGEDDYEDAAKRLSQRFEVKFKPNGEAEYIVDLVEGNRVYKPGPKWDAKLKSVCHSFKGEEPFANEDAKIEEKQDEVKDRIKELKEGTGTDDFFSTISFGLIDVDNEMEDLDHVDNDNLRELIAMTGRYDEAINGEINSDLGKLNTIASSSDITGSEDLVGLIRGLDPESVRAKGLVGDLEALFKLISTAFGKNNTTNRAIIAETTVALEKGDENPIEKRGKASELFKDAIEAKNWSTEDMLSAYTNNESLIGDISGGATENQKIMQNYKSQQKIVMKAHIVSNLGLSNSLIGLTSPSNNNFVLKLRKGSKIRKLTLTIKADKITIVEKGMQDRVLTDNTTDTLKTALAATPKAEEAVETVAKRTDEEVYKEVLGELKSGKLRDFFKKVAKTLKVTKKTNRNLFIWGNGTQADLNERRITFITSKEGMEGFKSHLESTYKEEIIAARQKKPKPTMVASAETTP